MSYTMSSDITTAIAPQLWEGIDRPSSPRPVSAGACRWHFILRLMFAASITVVGLSAFEVSAADESAADANMDEEATSASDTAASDTAEAANDTPTPANTEDDAPDNDSESSNTDAPAKVLRAVPYPEHARHQQLITHLTLQNRQQEVVPLLAGDDNFDGLFLRERSGEAQGGALILHDIAQHAHWPSLTGPLRESLPDHGWTTLSIALPDPNQDRNAYDLAIRARINAGLDYLASRGQLNVALIAPGDSVVWAAGALQARQRATENARGLALVMIDAREHALSALTVEQVLETLDAPILDLITDDRSADAATRQWQQTSRLGAMKRKKRQQYHQIEQSTRDTPERIVRRIRGWLKRHAAGTELPN